MAVYSFYAYAPTALTYNSGSGTWTLDPAYDFREDRVHIEITDDDNIFNGDAGADELGSDTNQTGVVTEPDGTPIASGRIYDEEYYEVAKPGGGSIWIERVEIGGQLVGYMVSEEMTPGTAYSETTRRDVNDPDNTEEPYSSWTSLPCYAAGTLIETEFGQTPIEDIRPATRVRTHDAGLVPVIWVGHRHISTRMQAADHRLRPVKISKGALGGHEPADDLIVSPQHRILLHTRDEISAPLKGIFAPAKGLINVQGIRLTSGKKPVTYHHLLCRSHQIIRANGCWSETLFPGAVAFEMLGQLAARDITKLLGRSLTTYTLARPCLTVREARDLYHSDDAHTPMKRARHRPVQNHSDPSNLIC